MAYIKDTLVPLTNVHVTDKMYAKTSSRKENASTWSDSQYFLNNIRLAQEHLYHSKYTESQ